MTRVELECRWAWYAAMRDMLLAPWIGFRSEREALRRTCALLGDEFKPLTRGQHRAAVTLHHMWKDV